MTTEIIPFDGLHLPAASQLLASRPTAVPFGSPAGQTEAQALEAVTALWQRPGLTGVAAMVQDRMLAYLLTETVTDMLWGRAVWMRLAGCAVAAGTDPEIIRDLYAAATAPLVRAGCFNHFIVLPAADTALLQAFYSLSFGIEQVHGIADLSSIDVGPHSLPPDITIRQATSEDRPILEDLSDVIWRHQAVAPVWGIHLPELREQRRKGYGELVEDKEAIIYLVFVDDEAAGMQAYFPPEAGPLDLLNHPEMLELCVAATRDKFRRRGIGTALTQYGFRAAKEARCRYILTDWRSTNLLSSRFWPRRGFRPVAYRLSRRVDSRIAWGGV